MLPWALVDDTADPSGDRLEAGVSWWRLTPMVAEPGCLNSNDLHNQRDWCQSTMELRQEVCATSGVLPCQYNTSLFEGTSQSWYQARDVFNLDEHCRNKEIEQTDWYFQSKVVMGILVLDDSNPHDDVVVNITWCLFNGQWSYSLFCSINNYKICIVHTNQWFACHTCILFSLHIMNLLPFCTALW